MKPFRNVQNSKIDAKHQGEVHYLKDFKFYFIEIMAKYLYNFYFKLWLYIYNTILPINYNIVLFHWKT